ncbi:MAG: DUF2807 domain-containing protein [Bacteroidetes bacterium]|nr:DUF2807 domain-containing protein [Bacteroidota bacterium]
MSQANFAQNKTLKGNGNVVKKHIDTGTFSELEIDGIYNVYLSQGNKESVEIYFDENLQEIVSVSNKNHQLNIHWKDGYTINEYTKMEVYITLTKIDKLDIDGVGNIYCQNTLHLNDLKLELEGVGNTKLNIVCHDLSANVAAVGNINFEGKATNFTIENSGVGNLRAYDFIAQNTKVNSSGIGNVEIYAQKNLNIDCSGIGNIRYKGNPEVVNIEKDGIGKVEKM